MQLLVTADQAITATGTVVRGVTPDLFGGPTPCADWDVRTLMNHVLQVVSAFTLAGRGQPVADDLWARDLMDDGGADRFDEESRAALVAWGRPEAWEGEVALGSSRLPVPLAATMLVSDLAIHGWDLARASGQRYRCTDDVAGVTYGFVTGMGEQGRQMGIFAAPHPVTGDASMFERALALSGRDPRWACPLQ